MERKRGGSPRRHLSEQPTAPESRSASTPESCRTARHSWAASSRLGSGLRAKRPPRQQPRAARDRRDSCSADRAKLDLSRTNGDVAKGVKRCLHAKSDAVHWYAAERVSTAGIRPCLQVPCALREPVFRIQAHLDPREPHRRVYHWTMAGGVSHRAVDEAAVQWCGAAMRPENPSESSCACCIAKVYVPGGMLSNPKRPFASVVVPDAPPRTVTNAFRMGCPRTLSYATPHESGPTRG